MEDALFSSGMELEDEWGEGRGHGGQSEIRPGFAETVTRYQVSCKEKGGG